MGGLIAVIAVLVVLAVCGALFADWWRHEHVSRLRDRARLRVIEGQMASLQAILRIQAAEYVTRQRMQAKVVRPEFGNWTDTGQT